MPWRECSVTEERLRVVLRLQDGEGMSELCREFAPVMDLRQKAGKR